MLTVQINIFFFIYPKCDLVSAGSQDEAGGDEVGLVGGQLADAAAKSTPLKAGDHFERGKAEKNRGLKRCIGAVSEIIYYICLCRISSRSKRLDPCHSVPFGTLSNQNMGKRQVPITRTGAGDEWATDEFIICLLVN